MYKYMHTEKKSQARHCQKCQQQNHLASEKKPILDHFDHIKSVYVVVLKKKPVVIVTSTWDFLISYFSPLILSCKFNVIYFGLSLVYYNDRVFEDWKRDLFSLFFLFGKRNSVRGCRPPSVISPHETNVSHIACCLSSVDIFLKLPFFPHGDLSGTRPVSEWYMVWIQIRTGV